MGIPTFFRSILQRNPKVLMGANSNKISTDYLFIDYNCIIYNIWHSLSKTLKTPLTPYEIENILISKVVEKTRHLIKNVVAPKEYTYIAMDGTAPRAKMVQQRSRRYKSIQLKEMMRTQQTHEKVEWDTTNISPGTEFMTKLSKALRKMMTVGDCGKVMLSDSSIPGEGEHKFLSKIRNLTKEEANKDKNVVVFSPDGDMISLSMLTHKKNIYIMRVPDPFSEYEKVFVDVYEYIYCDLNVVREHFYQDLIATYHDSNIDELKILSDYNFLMFMVGNDFVPSLYFLKIRSGGMKKLIQIYNDIRKDLKEYLVQPEIPSINLKFFTLIIQQLAMREQYEFRQEQEMIAREMNGQGRKSTFSPEMTPEENYQSRLEHLFLCHPDNPLTPQYKQEFNKIDYRDSKNWKNQYYQYFYPHNPTHYNNIRTEMVHNYFESIMFTLHYYLKGCPSWKWHYRFRTSPLPSDMYTVLTKHGFDINRISFPKSQPYTPFQQLMLILPPQMGYVLPPSLSEIMEEEEVKHLYPREFKVDAVMGHKYIYSEAILPELEEEKIFNKIKTTETKWTEKEKDRNTLRTKIWIKK